MSFPTSNAFNTFSFKPQEDSNRVQASNQSGTSGTFGAFGTFGGRSVFPTIANPPTVASGNPIFSGLTHQASTSPLAGTKKMFSVAELRYYAESRCFGADSISALNARLTGHIFKMCGAGNYTYSPCGLALPLNAAFAGADGITAEQARKLLLPAETPPEVSIMHSVGEQAALSKYFVNEGLISIGNFIYFRDDAVHHLKPEYEGMLKHLDSLKAPPDYPVVIGSSPSFTPLSF